MDEKEYIERETTVDALNRLCERVCQYSKAQRNVMCGACPLGDAFTVIEDNIPAANVRPVGHGKWKRIEDDFGKYDRCSNCGKEYSFGPIVTMHFCPNCGARMEKR